MAGLLIVCIYFLTLSFLQPHFPWLPWVAVVFIGAQYLFMAKEVIVSIFRDKTDFSKVLDGIDPSSQAETGFILTQEMLSALQWITQAEIFGQNHVIEPLITILQANAEIPDRERPLVSAAFFGPPGVGKSELAELIAKAVYESLDRHFFRVDSSQYTDHSMSTMTGSNRGYMGSDQPGALTSALEQTSGKLAILVDEPDRVNGDPKRWIQAWMPVLDGRVTEVATKREYATRNAMIFFASNHRHEKLGAIGEKYRSLKDKMKPAELAAAYRKEVMAVIDPEVFPKAVLDRLDYICIFAPLSREVIVDIVLKEITLLTQKHNMEVSFIDAEVLKEVIRVGMAGESTGARDFHRWVAEHVNPALVSAKRQNAKKIKLVLGGDGKVYATITEAHNDVPPTESAGSPVSGRPARGK